jgi:hypothetical protein
MPGRQWFLPVVLLASTTFCAAKGKPVVCVSVDTEQETLKSALSGFEKAAIKQASSKKYLAVSASKAERCDYTLSLIVTEERPNEVGVVVRTSNDPLLQEQAERPYIRFNVAYVLKRNSPADVLKEGAGFKREDSYPDPSARLSAVEDAVDNSLKGIKDKP